MEIISFNKVPSITKSTCGVASEGKYFSWLIMRSVLFKISLPLDSLLPP